MPVYVNCGYRNKEENQRAGVRYTLDTVVKELLSDPSKRFVSRLAASSKTCLREIDILRKMILYSDMT